MADDAGPQGEQELRGLLAEREAEVAAAQAGLAEAAARLRLALLASEPGLDPDLVCGETIAEVEASFAAAREAEALVRERVRREQAALVPAGAPGRDGEGPPLSAFEKIRAGLARR